MITPPFLLGVALLFWGWQAGWLWLDALAAVAIEVPRFARNRLHFAQADLDRIWNLCFVLFFGAFVVAFVTSDGATALTNMADNNSIANRIEALNKGGRSVILVLLWLPLIFLPIAIAQAFSDEPQMDWSTFSWWLRRQRGRGGARTFGGGVNVGWPYFALCLLATSATNERSLRFPIGVVLLTGWALWHRRARGFPLTAWAACLLATLGLALAAQFGMRQLQGLMQRLDSMIIARFISGRGFEPKETRTSMGAIGRLKLSGNIVLRVEATNTPPALLREASYRLFFTPSWVSAKQEFKDVLPESDLTTWKLLPAKMTRKQVTIAGFLPGGAGLLPSPGGVARFEDLPAVTMETNRLGVVRISEGPGFFRVVASFDEGASIDSRPDSMDEDIPAIELPAVTQTARELGLREMSPDRAVQKIGEFFAREFQYTTWQGASGRSRSNDTPLARFLLTNRAGHCEHFATATVLLLRAAGIPARYAVGYSVQERRGAEWIVRERHAHAWCLAWLDGAWRDIDHTPAGWSDLEAARAGGWEKVSDLWSDAWFKFSQWRWGKGEWKQHLIWLVVPLIGIAVWRLMAQKQWNRSRQIAGRAEGRGVASGMDSEFFALEKALAARGLERLEDETPMAWSRRLASSDLELAHELAPIIEAHYRLRFDPSGLSDRERGEFAADVRRLLARIESVLFASAKN